MEHLFFSIQLGISYSQLTFIFFRGVGWNHQPGNTWEDRTWKGTQDASRWLTWSLQSRVEHGPRAYGSQMITAIKGDRSGCCDSTEFQNGSIHELEVIPKFCGSLNYRYLEMAGRFVYFLVFLFLPRTTCILLIFAWFAVHYTIAHVETVYTSGLMFWGYSSHVYLRK